MAACTVVLRAWARRKRGVEGKEGLHVGEGMPDCDKGAPELCCSDQSENMVGMHGLQLSLPVN